MFTFCILLYASKRNLNIAQEEDQLSVTQLRKIRGICQTNGKGQLSQTQEHLE